MAKVEDLLHAANVVVSTVGVAAAGFTVPGAAAGIGGLLSAMPIARMVWPKSEPLEARVEKALAERLTTTPHLPKDADKLFPQMIVTGTLSKGEIIGAARDPEKICTAILVKLRDPEHTAHDMQAAFRKVLTPVFRELLADKKVSDELRPSFEKAVAQSLAQLQSVAKQLLALAERDATAPRVAEALLTALAYEFAGTGSGDINAAYRDLRAALEAAENLKRRAELPSNLDSQVRATLKAVTRRNDERDFKGARAQIDKDLARLDDEVAERNQARGVLLDSAIDQARVINDPEAAAEYVLKRLALDTTHDPFEALRAERRHWYETGRDKGRAFDLEVSIALARANLARANGADQRGTALNDLGTALQTLGNREPGSERLEEAVAAYRAALEEYTRDRVPFDRALTQMNLAMTELTLFQRAPDPALLGEAREQLVEAREVFTEGAPLYVQKIDSLLAAVAAMAGKAPGPAGTSTP